MNTTRLIVISGKGGVGKTTVACATAVTAAERGHRTLVVSLDRAHNLGDVLRVGIRSTATPVPGCPNLWAMEIDPQAEFTGNQVVLQNYFSKLFSYLGAQGATAQEMAVFPGLEELLVLTRLAELAEAGDYDVIVTDMAPTASSLRYLSFPGMMEGVLGKLVTWDQRFANLLRPFQGKYLKVPVPDTEVYDSIRDVSARLDRLKNLLENPERTVVRLVMVPERIVLEETRRALTYFSLFGLTVDAVIVNRIFPQAALGAFFEGWGQVQSRVLQDTAESLSDLPLLKLQFQPQEVLCVEHLRSAGHELYGSVDPIEFHDARRPLTYEQAGDAIVLTIRLPNGSGTGLDLRQRDRNLTITVNGWRRTILLPDFLDGLTVAKARFAEGQLTVRFENPGIH